MALPAAIKAAAQKRIKQKTAGKENAPAASHSSAFFFAFMVAGIGDLLSIIPWVGSIVAFIISIILLAIFWKINPKIRKIARWLSVTPGIIEFILGLVGLGFIPTFLALTFVTFMIAKSRGL